MMLALIGANCLADSSDENLIRKTIDPVALKAGIIDDSGDPICAAVDGTHCYYVAPDGDDTAEGTVEAPFKTFLKALKLVQAGDYIYARGGRYGKDNAMLIHLERLPKDQFPPPCAEGQVEADGYCQVPQYDFATISEWSGYPENWEHRYNIASGNPGRPITLRNYPGERPVLDMDALRRSDDIEEALVMWQKPAISIGRSHWVIRGFEVVGGSVNLYHDIEDIVIEHCEIHDLIRDGGDNPGLIRLNRGPENVRIRYNRLYNIFDSEFPGKWGSVVQDAQHFGAVTTLSGETYGGTDDTGAVEISNNVIFHVPQVFFFKNQAKGPIEIKDNHIYDSGRLASNASSNVHVVGNLVHGVATGFWRQGLGYTAKGDGDPAVLAIDGQNLVMEYNSFVGLEGTLVKHLYGKGRTLRHNVIFGLPGRAQDAGWDSASYLKGGEGFPDETVISDNNCFIVPAQDFQHLALYLKDGEHYHLEHYSLDESRSSFSLDLNSAVVVSSDPSEVFIDPDNLDYVLKPQLPQTCRKTGHYQVIFSNSFEW